MQFTTQVQPLLDSLSVVTRALASRPARPILDGVLIDAAGSTVTLTCSDGSMTIESSVAAEIASEGQIVVPGRLLNDLIRRLPGGDVTFRLVGDNRLQVTCLSSRSSLTAQSAAEYPEVPQMGSLMQVEAAEAELRQMISGVVFSIATDESRQLLTGCLLEVLPGELRMVALDGFRLAMQVRKNENTLPAGKEKYRVVIPGRVMNELARVLPDNQEEKCVLTFDASRVRVEFGTVRFSSVLLQGEYIDYDRIIPKNFATEILISRTEFLDAIDRASLMAREGRNNLVKLHVDAESLSIVSNADMGEVHEEMSCAMNGNPIDIAFNAKYLSDAIRNIDQDEIRFCFNSNVSPSVIRPKEGEGYLYLVLPVRTF